MPRALLSIVCCRQSSIMATTTTNRACECIDLVLHYSGMTYTCPGQNLLGCYWTTIIQQVCRLMLLHSFAKVPSCSTCSPQEPMMFTEWMEAFTLSFLIKIHVLRSQFNQRKASNILVFCTTKQASSWFVLVKAPTLINQTGCIKIHLSQSMPLHLWT